LYVVCSSTVLLPAAVTEATDAYRRWMSSSTNCKDEPNNDRGPPPYRHVKVSLTCGCGLLMQWLGCVITV